MWNKSIDKNKCLKCYQGRSPAMVQEKFDFFIKTNPSVTPEEILNYPISASTTNIIYVTLLFLGGIWIGALIQGWLLAFILGVVGVYIARKNFLEKQTQNIIEQQRLQTYFLTMVVGFSITWFITWISSYSVLFSSVVSSNITFSPQRFVFLIWLIPSIIAILLGMAAVAYKDKPFKEEIAEKIRTHQKET